MGGDDQPQLCGGSVDCEFSDVSHIKAVLHLKSIRGHTEARVLQTRTRLNTTKSFCQNHSSQTTAASFWVHSAPSTGPHSPRCFSVPAQRHHAGYSLSLLFLFGPQTAVNLLVPPSLQALPKNHDREQEASKRLHFISLTNSGDG